MKFAKVAIITRTKDRPTFLDRAIKSVHGQTEKDFIQVVYNDGGNKEAVDRQISGYGDEITSRIVIVHGEGSDRMEDTLFNPAIRTVNSVYIAIHDDDDTWHPEFLEKSIQTIEESGKGGVVVRTDKVTEEITGDTIREIKVERWMPDLKAINLYRQCTENQMTAITFLYKRDIFEKIGGYDDSLAVCGDWDFGIRFLVESDVDYLDPGFALAFYHHRTYRKNAEGNTSGAGNDRFAYFTNQLLNKYLRQELKSGQLGIGYIMSQHRFNESYITRLAQRVMPRALANRLKRRAQS